MGNFKKIMFKKIKKKNRKIKEEYMVTFSAFSTFPRFMFAAQALQIVQKTRIFVFPTK